MKYLVFVFLVLGLAPGIGSTVNSISSIASDREPPPHSNAMEDDRIQQHHGFTHLEVVDGVARLSGYFENPDSPGSLLNIEWTLFGWDKETGDENKDMLSKGKHVSNYQQAAMNELIPVPSYHYYQATCRNVADLTSKADAKQYVVSESRYSTVPPYNGIWERTGEVSSDRAILHTYLTEKLAPANIGGNGADWCQVPPMAGYARFVVCSDESLSHVIADSDWHYVDDYIQDRGQWHRSNYNFRWVVTGLEPDTRYYYFVRTKSSDGATEWQSPNVNTFRTAPGREADRDVVFTVVTGMDTNNTQEEGLGLKLFRTMREYDEQDLDFLILTGDTVYYDFLCWMVPVGFKSTLFLKRWHSWYGMYHHENLRTFFQNVPGYWMVDDHDYWVNNACSRWPDGWHIFRNANPTPGSPGTTGEDCDSYYDDNPYGTSSGSGESFWRSVHWGRHLELFIEEGRHHRDTQNLLDLRIWGNEQQSWLEERITQSDATFKVVVASTPLLGPPNSAHIRPDKHANLIFREETRRFLTNVKDVPNVFLVCGDRHWKYHSVINAANHPDLAHFNEFCCGSAVGGNHADTPTIRDNEWAETIWADGDVSGKCGGYLRVEISSDPPEISFKLLGVSLEYDNYLLYTTSF